MSIIEKALGKLQQVAPARSADPAQTGRHQRQAIHPTARPHEARQPTESISLSEEELRLGGVLPPADHAGMITDQFRRIKWPILEAAIAPKPSAEARQANRVMVTSSIAGEGKTFISVNLALSIAREKDFSVLLIDADVAKRHVTELLKLGDRQGLTDVIADPALDPEDFVIGTSVPGLNVLPAGRRSSTAPELFASQRMVELLDRLGRHDPRRIVLLDTSPLLATNESQVLAKLIDQVVLVVRAESTSQPMLLDAIAMLDDSKQIRCVLNQSRTSNGTEYYYGYYPHDRLQE